MGRYLNLYRIMSGTFGTRLRPLATFALFQLRALISGITMFADDVLFPSWRKRPLDRPVFIIGNPRSGTTFLHRLLLGAGDLAAFELWEQMFPAITARKALGRVVPRMNRVNPAKYHASDVHETSMRGIETDDLLWFFRTLDGPFAWAYFLSWRDTWGSDSADREFGIAEVSPKQEDRFFGYHEACWKRNLHLKGKGRILVKSSMLTFRVKALLRRYPDAKLVYVSRDPAETIPSGISMLFDVLERGYGIGTRTDEGQRKHWLDNLYRASAAMMTSFHREYTAGAIPAENLLVVRYSDLIGDLSPTIRRVLEFIEVDAPQHFLDEVDAQDRKQKGRVSAHRYSPEQFGLTTERIRDDLGDVFDTFERSPVS